MQPAALHCLHPLAARSRSILSGKVGDPTEASLSKPWLGPRRAAPEPHPSFPGKTPEYEQRPHRLEKRAWGHLSDTTLAELVLTHGLFWKLSVPPPELPLQSCSHCLFSCFLTTTTAPTTPGRLPTARMGDTPLPYLIYKRPDHKQRLQAQPAHSHRVWRRVQLQGSDTCSRRPQPRHTWKGWPGLRSANPPPPGALSHRNGPCCARQVQGTGVGPEGQGGLGAGTLACFLIILSGPRVGGNFNRTLS